MARRLNALERRIGRMAARGGSNGAKSILVQGVDDNGAVVRQFLGGFVRENGELNYYADESEYQAALRRAERQD